jgi:RimJ/RimL family protein N-acetyltransferase
MLKGDVIRLRTVREADLDTLYDFHQDLSNSGEYYPLEVVAEPVFKRRFHETGYWEEKNGILLIVDDSDKILGQIEYFKTVPYLDEIEIAYYIYTQEHRGKGIATEALRLMTGYLFNIKTNNRIRVNIHPHNLASKRVAEKCGYQYEGTARGAWFHRGQNQDVEVHAILRADHHRFG